MLTRSRVEFPETTCYASVDELLAALSENQTVWVVGGAEIYRTFLPRCTFLYLSRIKGTFSGDVFFPPFEEQFKLDQVIHENADFRVERWVHMEKTSQTFDPELWPNKPPA